MYHVVFLLAFAPEVGIYRLSDWSGSVLVCALDLGVLKKEGRESMTTRKSQGLDSATLALEILAKSGMLGRLPSAIKSFDDYQGTP